MRKSAKLRKIKLFTFALIFIFGSLTILAQTPENKEPVKFNLIVTDNDKNFVNDLSKDDISLFIDGKAQPDFTLEKETLPLLYMISIDNSNSMSFLLDDVKKSVKTMIGQNQTGDLAALMRFIGKDKIQVTDKFSSDKEYLFKNLEMFQTERGKTAVIDALCKSVEIISGQIKGRANYRQIVVIISDGEDRDSAKSLTQLSKLLTENNVQVFFVGLVIELDQEGGLIGKSAGNRAREFIENIAGESGGAAVFPEKIEDLPKIADQIVNQMRTQFVVKIPPGANLANKKIEIKPAKNSSKRKLKFFYRR
jgi:VWFA-related protein